MTLRSHFTRILAWWTRRHPSKVLERIPEYRRAAEAERRAKARGCTQAVGRARIAKRAAVHKALSQGIGAAVKRMEVV